MGDYSTNMESSLPVSDLTLKKIIGDYTTIMGYSVPASNLTFQHAAVALVGLTMVSLVLHHLCRKFMLGRPEKSNINNNEIPKAPMGILETIRFTTWSPHEYHPLSVGSSPNFFFLPSGVTLPPLPPSPPPIFHPSTEDNDGRKMQLEQFFSGKDTLIASVCVGPR